MGRDNGGKVHFPVLGVLERGCIAAEIARLTDLVKGVDLRMTKGTDGIESDDREKGRKEQCSEKKDEERRLRGGRVITRKTK